MDNNLIYKLKSIYGKDIKIQGIKGSIVTFVLIIQKDEKYTAKIYPTKAGFNKALEYNKEFTDVEIVSQKYYNSNTDILKKLEKFDFNFSPSIYELTFDMIAKKYDLYEYAKDFDGYIEIPAIECIEKKYLKHRLINMYIYIQSLFYSNKKMYSALNGNCIKIKASDYNTDGEYIPCILMDDDTRW